MCIRDSYYDVTNGDLKYIRATDASGSTWGSPLTLDATYDVGQYASLCIDVYKRQNVNMPVGTKLYFTDKLLNKTIEVTPAFEYWFTVDTSAASWGNNRFELNTQGVPTNSITNVNASKLKVKLVPNPATDNVTIYYEGAAKELNICLLYTSRCV